MTEHNSSDAPKPVGPYPHARRVGDLLFLSGVGPRLPDSNEIPGNIYSLDGELAAYDFRLQCDQVFENVRAILDSAGADLSHLVDVTVFLTDMKNDFKTFNEIYSEFFLGFSPCRTTVEVGSLPTPIAIELKCIAHFES
jgi:2-aminomuconate deaminase